MADARWRELLRVAAYEPDALRRLIHRAAQMGVFSGYYLRWLATLKIDVGIAHVGKVAGSRINLHNYWQRLTLRNRYANYHRILFFYLEFLEMFKQDPLYARFAGPLGVATGIIHKLQAFGPHNLPTETDLRVLQQLRSRIGMDAMSEYDQDYSNIQELTGDELRAAAKQRGAESVIGFAMGDIEHLVAAFIPEEEYCEDCGEDMDWNWLLAHLPGGYATEEYLRNKYHVGYKLKKNARNKARRATTKKLVEMLQAAEYRVWQKFYKDFVPGEIWN